MFRRKEEGNAETGNDLVSAIAANEPAQMVENETAEKIETPAATSEAVAFVPQPAAIPAPSAAITANNFVPQRPAPASQQPVVSPYRSTATTAQSEFNRSATRPFQDSPRNAAPIGHNSEKQEEVVKKAPRVLTVGNDILLKGEVTACDRVVIEGKVEAKLSEVDVLAIAACGSFKGTAEVDQAEINGLFEGDLIVKHRLVIYATGEVRGNITYGEIEIERGGKLTGQIKTVADVAANAKPNLLDVLDKKASA